MQKPVSRPPDHPDADYVEWQREFEVKRQRLLKEPYIANTLSVLEGKGADQDELLSLLVLSCPTKSAEMARETLTQRIKSLRSQAKKLELAATELESMFASDLVFAETWKYLLFSITFEHAPNFARARTAIKLWCERTRKVSRALKGEAATFARLLKHYPRLNDKAALGALLRFVLKSTGHYHERTLAPLLTAAHIELGAEVDYNEEKLKKFRQRELKDLIRQRHSPFDTCGMLGMIETQSDPEITG